MKKLLTIALTALLSLCMLAGMAACNIDTGDEQSGNTGVSSEENPDATVELTVGTLATEYEQSLMQEWINQFQREHSEVSIKITRTFQGMAEIIDMKNMGVLPDIVWTAGDQHSNFSGSDHFYDLSDETRFPGSAEFFADFYPALIETTHYSADDDGIWFVPRDYNRIVVYLNATVFEQLGIDVPDADWTWEDFEAVCEQLMPANETAKVRRALEWKSWPPLWTTMLYNFGGAYFNDDGTPVLDSPETQACFDYLGEFLSTYTLTGTGNSFKSFSVDNLGASVPMIFDVRPQLSEYMQAAYNQGFELQVLPFPNFVQEDGSAGYTGAGCSGYAITTACTDSEELEWAWKFLQYCMSEAGYEDVGYLGNIVPALMSLADTGSWTTYSYGGMSVDYTAFTADNTEDLFLNYYNVVDWQYHDSIRQEVAMFWDRVQTYTYTNAIEAFNTNIEDILNG